MSETEVRNETEQKKIHITLDDLPFGDESNVEEMMSRKKEKLPDGVTSGQLYRDILKLAWPSLIELALVTLASMVDMMMVGRLGPWAITSVGLAATPRLLFVTMLNSINVGATAHVARCRGAGDRMRANSYLKQALFFKVIFSIVLGALGYVFAEDIIKLMGAKEASTLIGGTQYLRVQCMGMLAYGLCFTISAGLRGVGNTKTAMIYNVIANVVNIIFNYLLIEGHFGFPRLEVLGASIATIIGVCVATCMAVIVILRKKNYVYVDFTEGYRIKPDQIKDILVIGIPAMGEQVAMRLGAMMFNRIIAEYGSAEQSKLIYAAHQVLLNIMSLSMMNGMAFATASTTLMGQSIGKLRPDMARSYTRRCLGLSLCVSACLFVLFLTCGKGMAWLYSDDKTVINLCHQCMIFLSFLQPFLTLQFVLSGALRGAGDTKRVAMYIFFTCIILRLTVGYVLVHVANLGLTGAWITMLVDQAARSILISTRFFSGKWQKVFRERLHISKGT